MKLEMPWDQDAQGAHHTLAAGYHGIVDARGRNHAVWYVDSAAERIRLAELERR